MCPNSTTCSRSQRGCTVGRHVGDRKRMQRVQVGVGHRREDRGGAVGVVQVEVEHPTGETPLSRSVHTAAAAVLR